MKTDSFFESPKSWSKRKHRLLGKYLPPFSAKVGSWAKEIYCVDGFAGAAKYNDGSAGSPLMMAHLADKCAAWKKPVNLRLINVETNADHFSSLHHLTESWETRGIVTNLLGEFGKLVPNIISQTNDAPTLFFIDPYGPTYVLFSHLLPILTRGQKATELIINFDADGLRRIGDTIHANVQTSRAMKAAQTNIAKVTEIIGSDQWKSKFERDNLSTQEREKALLYEYIENITKYGYTVVAYAIRKSIKHSPKYYLVYCTRHRDGIILMNSFIREEEDELLKDSTATPNQPTFPLEEFDMVQQETIQRRRRLHQLISDYLQNKQKTMRGQIKHHFIFEHFGDFHEKDYNAVVQELMNDGKLKAEHGRKRINDNEQLFYVPD